MYKSKDEEEKSQSQWPMGLLRLRTIAIHCDKLLIMQSFYL